MKVLAWSWMDDQAAIRYLRRRRATYFFGNAGPGLPAGMTARWRLTRGEPKGWHANMVGFVDGSPAELDALLDIAIAWFTRYEVDTWVDVDEFGVLWNRQELLQHRDFQLRDDWDVMLCRQLAQPAASSHVRVELADQEDQIRTAAWIAEQSEQPEPVEPTAEHVLKRAARYWREHTQWHSRFVVAMLDEQPVGTARLTSEDLPVLVGVATLPEARGQGIATAVTAALTDAAIREHGACALYVERDSQAARIYHRSGFHPLFRMRAWVRSRGKGS